MTTLSQMSRLLTQRNTRLKVNTTFYYYLSSQKETLQLIKICIRVNELALRRNMNVCFLKPVYPFQRYHVVKLWFIHSDMTDFMKTLKNKLRK